MRCDLPFDESEIAPELHKGNCSVDMPDSRHGKEESPQLKCANLETVDISIGQGASKILSTPPQNKEQEVIEATVEQNRTSRRMPQHIRDLNVESARDFKFIQAARWSNNKENDQKMADNAYLFRV